MYFGDNKDITYLAKTNFRNKEQVFGIKRRDRRQHMYVLGKSGTGKSVLLYNMIIQNIANGSGVCVVDPHGELVEDVLKSIPSHRLDDVIYFNPADITAHMGFNVLEIDDPKYKHLVASGLMGIFTKIWANAWSARMEYILNNAILALLDTPGTTLLGIPRILVDKDYRQRIIDNLKDPVVKAFWVHEYEAWQDKFRNEAIAPIQNKVGQFLSTSIIRNVVGQSKSTINIFNIMNDEKVFLVNVSKGRIGEDNSALLGGMLITKIQLAAMERVRIPEDERKDFYLYVDEFQNFVTDSFASILSEARKYRLSLTIAHQYTGQLMTEAGPAVRDAVFGNVGTMIIFRVGAEDATFLEKEFEPEFTVEDIVNQPNYHVYMKLMVDGITSRPFSAWTLPPYKAPEGEANREKIIVRSKELYSRPREVVEKEINTWSGVKIDDDGSISQSESKSLNGKWKAVCSQCGTEMDLPFEPKPGRPVYCKDCMQKIKNGEIKPVQNFKLSPKKEEASYEALAGIGVEFGGERKVSPRKPDYNNGKEVRSPRPGRDTRNTEDRTPKFKMDDQSNNKYKFELGKILKEALENKNSQKSEAFDDGDEEELSVSLSEMAKHTRDFDSSPEDRTVVSKAVANTTPNKNSVETSRKETIVNKEKKEEKTISSTLPQINKKEDKSPLANFAKKETSDENKNSLKNALLLALKKNTNEKKEEGEKRIEVAKKEEPEKAREAQQVVSKTVAKDEDVKTVSTQVSKAPLANDAKVESVPQKKTSKKEVPRDILEGIFGE